MRRALRGSSRRRCLPLLLLLTQEFALGTGAASVNRRDLSDPSRGGKDLYQVQDSDRYCKMCPAGTYVAEHCEVPNGTSKCLPCNKSEYIEYPNAFHRCLGCQTCREDQVELSPCRADRNTQCACKPGSFCSPDHSCEMCQKCRPRCPQGEVELASCTPHSDRQCGPPTGTSSGLSIAWIVIISLVVVGVVILFVVFLCTCHCRRSSGDGRDLSGKSCSVVDYLVRQLPCSQRGGLGTQDNIHNEEVSRDQLLGLNSGSVTPRAPELEEATPRTSYTDVKPRRKLVPVQEEDPVKLLRRCFYIFAEKVPLNDWKRYGRALDLLENEIAFAMNEPSTQESFYQMLNTWQNKQGMNASVNTLLETLHEINLSGIAEDIASKLVQRGLFQYEAS
ncbi:tumor necrosis factor receptor superfamily member 10B-like isoform X3 [Patagioenas fasciata]|uniref:tumor necrosis factor receptor superfamily member 10B-like isoform X3 n=1 Tax=Patagioenas fasciata TaxID=372321 RepID=UPI0032E869B4